MAWYDDLANLIPTAGSLTAAYLPYKSTEDVMERIRSTAGTFKTGAEQLAEEATQTAAFQPFAVKTGTGTAQVGAGGALDIGLGAESQALQQGLLQQARAGIGQPTGMGGYTGLEQQALGQAASLLGQPTPTAQSLYQQMQAMTAPDIQRQRQQLQQQLQAQGRGGVQTAMYGGTPEQLAMEKAIAEQQAANVFQAQQLAPQLALQQQQQAAGLFGLGQQAGMTPAQREAANLANVQAALTGAYVPQAQQLATLTPALSAAQIAQSAGASGAEALTNLGIQGLSSEAALQSALAELEKGRASALGQSLAGMFTSEAAANTDWANTLQGIENSIRNLINLFD